MYNHIINDIVTKSDLDSFSTEDYFVMKQNAYDFLGQHDMKYFVQYNLNTLGYEGNEPSFRLIFTTVCSPFDKEFCDLYNQYNKQLNRLLEEYQKVDSIVKEFSLEKEEVHDEKILAELMKKTEERLQEEINNKDMLSFYDSNPNCSWLILEVKAYEVDRFQLDLAIEQGVLQIPEKKKTEEKSKKTA